MDLTLRVSRASFSFHWQWRGCRGAWEFEGEWQRPKAHGRLHSGLLNCTSICYLFPELEHYRQLLIFYERLNTFIKGSQSWILYSPLTPMPDLVMGFPASLGRACSRPHPSLVGLGQIAAPPNGIPWAHPIQCGQRACERFVSYLDSLKSCKDREETEAGCSGEFSTRKTPGAPYPPPLLCQAPF